MNEKILVGSRAFFGDMEGFNSKDRDYLLLVENPIGFRWRRESSMRGICLFEYLKEPVSEMVARTIQSGDALSVGKFLVKEVADVIGALPKDILPLEVLLPKLDTKHEYEKIIFAAIQENQSFDLTDAQKKAAYEIYLSARKQSTNKHKDYVYQETK